MEQITMYALYDKKAEMYDTPVFMLKEVQAKRWFYSLMQKQEGRFEYFSDDMELYEIGQFNVNSGEFKPKDKPKLIIDAIQIGKEKKANEISNAT